MGGDAAARPGRPPPPGRSRARSATPVSRCQRKRRTPRTTKLPTRAPTPTAIALAGRERPDRAQRQQAVEHERPEDAGRDQRGQLVEGAVADPAVVVVVEAVELDDQDPGRAEEDRPEQRRDVGARGRRGDDAERGDQRQPVADREQPPQQRAAPPRARSAPGQAGARSAALRPPAPSGASRLLGRAGSSAVLRSFTQAGFEGIQLAGLFAGRLRRRPSAGFVLDRGAQVVAAASCRPRGRSPCVKCARSRLAYSPCSSASRPSWT